MSTGVLTDSFIQYLTRALNRSELVSSAASLGELLPGIGNLDMFGRLRTSEPETLIDVDLLNDAQPLLISESLTGSATATYGPNEPSVTLSITSAPGDRAVRQTRQYSPYQPGKSFFVLATGVLAMSIVTGAKSRIGLFDSASDKTEDTFQSGDGFFFELDGAALGVVKRSYVSGAEVDTRIEQAQWNGDPLDGTGASGVSVDPTKAQIFWIAKEWLGVGSVAMGIIIDGVFITAHVFHHANAIAGPYTTRPSLPVRYEIQNVSAGTAASMKQICCTVISEGGFNPRGLIWSADRGTAAKSVSTTELPILSIRLKAGYRRATIRPREVEVYAASVSDLIYSVYIVQDDGGDTGGVLTDPVWTSVPNGATEYDISATAFAAGGTTYKIESGYTTNQSTSTIDLSNTLAAAANIAGLSDLVVITAKKMSAGNINVYAQMTWQEYR